MLQGRCIVCRDVSEYDDVTLATRCVGCGAAQTVRRVHEARPPSLAPPRPGLPVLARELEAALAANRKIKEKA